VNVRDRWKSALLDELRKAFRLQEGEMTILREERDSVGSELEGALEMRDIAEAELLALAQMKEQTKAQTKHVVALKDREVEALETSLEQKEQEFMSLVGDWVKTGALLEEKEKEVETLTK
jgi:hypothetical protein